MTFKAIVSRDKSRVIMVDGNWRHTIAAADLPKCTKFYRDLHDRKGGAYAKFYVAPLEALEAAAAQLREVAT
jgi:hypothetical protein